MPFELPLELPFPEDPPELPLDDPEDVPDVVPELEPPPLLVPPELEVWPELVEPPEVPDEELEPPELDPPLEEVTAGPPASTSACCFAAKMFFKAVPISPEATTAAMPIAAAMSAYSTAAAPEVFRNIIAPHSPGHSSKWHRDFGGGGRLNPLWSKRMDRRPAPFDSTGRASYSRGPRPSCCMAVSLL